MMVSALEECPGCCGTGIQIIQKPWPGQSRVEISLSICMCVRVVPVLLAQGCTPRSVAVVETASDGKE